MDVKISNRALSLLALCFIAAYIWPFHPHPFGGFISDWLALLGVLILCAFQLTEPNIQVRLPWIAIIPLGLALVILLQTLSGMLLVWWDGLLPIAYLCMAALAMMLGAGLTVEEKDGAGRLCTALAGAHLLAGLLSVVIAAIQFVHKEAAFGGWIMSVPRNLGGTVRPFANIAQPNQLALLFCMSIGALWWLHQTARLSARLSAVLVLPLLMGLALSQSRIGWIIVPAFAVLLIYWNQRRMFKITPVWLISVFVLFYGVLVAVLPFISTAMGLVTDTLAQRAGGDSVRVALIKQALQISLAHPWFGVGWYQFGPQQVALGAIYPGNIYAEHSHNIVANFAAELGWPITLATFSVLGYWFYKVCICRPVSKEAGFATLVFLAVLVHSMTEYPLWYAYVLMPVSLLMGMLHQQRFGGQAKKLPSLPLAGMVALISLCLIGAAADFRRLHLGFQALGFEVRRLTPLVGSTAKPDFTLFPYFYDYFKFAKTTNHVGLPPEEIAFLEGVARRFPYDIVLQNMADIYALNGRPDEALRTMLAYYALHQDTYNKNYYLWQYFAAIRPDIYAAVFSRMPLPRPSMKP